AHVSETTLTNSTFWGGKSGVQGGRRGKSALQARASVNDGTLRELTGTTWPPISPVPPVMLPVPRLISMLRSAGGGITNAGPLGKPGYAMLMNPLHSPARSARGGGGA